LSRVTILRTAHVRAISSSRRRADIKGRRRRAHLVLCVRVCVWSTVRRCSSAPDANCRRSSRAKTYTRGLGGGGGGGEIADVICGCSEMRRQRGQRGHHLLGGLGSLQADRSRCSLSVALSSTHCHNACRHGPGARFTIYLTIIIRLS